MKKNIKEFINSDMGLIHSKVPNLDPKITAKKTTDGSIPMRTQPYNYTIYNIKLQEKELEHSKKAAKYSKDPKKFHDYLQSIGEGDKFEEYFETKKTNESFLKTVSKNKFFDLVENILEEEKTQQINEIKQKEPILMEKLNKITETIKSVLNENERDVLLKYLNKRLK